VRTEKKPQISPAVLTHPLKPIFGTAEAVPFVEVFSAACKALIMTGNKE
jgi:hypothetical protein